MWWLIAILISILLYLLFAPFYLEIDSGKGLFRIRFHRLVSGNLLFRDNSIYVQLRIISWSKKFDLLADFSEKKTPAIKQGKKKTKRITFQKMIRVVRTFQVKKLFVTLDTGNMQTNGILYPMAYALRLSSGKNVSINFRGENKIILQIKNNAARILWAFIRS